MRANILAFPEAYVNSAIIWPQTDATSRSAHSPTGRFGDLVGMKKNEHRQLNSLTHSPLCVWATAASTHMQPMFY